MNHQAHFKSDPATSRLLQICRQLDAARIQHQIVRQRGDAVSIYAAIPGERWEIDIEEDGTCHIECFKSTEQEGGLDLLNKLLLEAAEA